MRFRTALRTFSPWPLVILLAAAGLTTACNTSTDSATDGASAPPPTLEFTSQPRDVAAVKTQSDVVTVTTGTNTILVADLLANDTGNPDASTFALTGSTSEQGLSLTLNAAKTEITYDPGATPTFGWDRFEYTVCETGNTSLCETGRVQLVVSGTALSCGTINVQEGFRTDSTHYNWVFKDNNSGKNVKLTSSKPNDPDPVGEGWLELAPPRTSHYGAAFLDEAFPSTEGVSISFELASWGGAQTGGDGDLFFLVDGDKVDDSNFALGGEDGSLGYAPNTTKGNPGMAHAVAGIAFDHWGGFWNAKQGRTGPDSGVMPAGTDADTLVPNNVTVRAGALKDWKTLFVKKVPTSVVKMSCSKDAGCTNRPTELGDGRYKVILNLIPLDNGQKFHVDVYIQGAPNSAYVQVVNTDIDQKLPDNLKLGFIGASGGQYTAHHEIRDVSVTSLVDLKMDLTSSKSGVLTNGNTVTYTYTATNKTAASVCAAEVDLTLPPNFIVTSQSCATGTGDSTCGALGTSGVTNDVIAIAGNDVVTITVKGTVHPSAGNPIIAIGSIEPRGAQGDSNPDDNLDTVQNADAPSLKDHVIGVKKGDSGSFDVSDDASQGSKNIDYGSVVILDTGLPNGVTATVDSNGKITVSVDSNYSGSATTTTFTYTVADTAGNTSAPATVTVNILSNTPPAVTVPDASGGEIWTSTGTPSVDFDVDTDIASDITVSSQPTGGNASVNGQKVTFTPTDPDAADEYPVEVKACETPQPTNCTTTTVTVIYNDPPTINGGSTTTTPGIPTSLPLNVDAGSKGTVDTTQTTLTDDGNGACTLDSGNVKFDPRGVSTNTTVTCTIEGCEEKPAGLCETGDFEFTVAAPFTPTDDTIDGAQGESTTVTTSTLLSNDGNADSTSVTLVSGSEVGGTVTLQNNQFVFLADDNAPATGSFKYHVCSNLDRNDCQDVKVTVDIAAKPGATSATYWTQVDTPITTDDPFVGTTTTNTVLSSPNGNTTVQTDGSITVTPNAGYVGDIVVTVRGCTATPVPACTDVDLTVTVNDLPTVTNDGDSATVTPGGSQSITVDADPQKVGDIDWSTLVVQSGDCQISGHTVTYTADANAAAGTSEDCTIQICELKPANTCTTADYTFNIQAGFFPSDDNLSATEDTDMRFQEGDLTQNDGNADGGSFQIGGTKDGNGDYPTDEGGTLTPDGQGGYTYTPPAGFTGDDSFTYNICSGVTGETRCEDVTVTVTVNEAPTMDDVEIWVPTGTSSVEIPLKDHFNGITKVGSTTLPPHLEDGDGNDAGSIKTSLDTDGNTVLSVTPDDPDAPAQYDFPLEVCDNATPVACTTANITVVYNDAPTIADDGAIVTPGGSQSIAIDADAGEQGNVDWTTLTVIGTAPTNGTCALDGHKVVFTANADATVGDTATCEVKVCEASPAGIDACGSGVFTFDIQNIFNPTDDDVTTIENTPVSIVPDDLTRNDGNNDPDSFELNGTPDTDGNYTTNQGGTLSPDGNGGYTYNPPADFTGEDTFTYHICSAIDTNDCTDVTVTVDVTEKVRITSPQDGGNTTDPTPEITGTGQPNTTVTIYLDGDTDPAGTANVDSYGNWSWTPTDDLDEGEHTVDVEGENGSTDTSTFTVDEPTDGDGSGDVTISGPADGATACLQGTQAVTVHGTSAKNTSVVIQIDGEKVAQLQANGTTGSWTWTADLDEALEPGSTHAVTAVGANGSSSTVNITIDEDCNAPGDGNDGNGDGNDNGEGLDGQDPNVAIAGGRMGSCNAAGGGMSGGGIAILALLAAMALIERRRRNA